MLAVIAKAPAPGACKTRLCPPLSPVQAARLAEASLRDTLDCVAAVPASRHVLILDGTPCHWLRAGFEVIPQRGGGLAERLACAVQDIGAPVFIIGMDTPQLTSATLASALAQLRRNDAAIGPALDGGYWGIGLSSPAPEAFSGVPMSAPQTLTVQLRRLHELGLSCARLAPLRDVDTIADALDVAQTIPQSRFALELAAMHPLARAA